MRRALLLAFTAVVLLAGCEEDNNAVALCTAVCDCGSIAPIEYSRCMSECVADVPEQVEPACVECILTASCAGLQSNACSLECQVQN